MFDALERTGSGKFDCQGSLRRSSRLLASKELNDGEAERSRSNAVFSSQRLSFRDEAPPGPVVDLNRFDRDSCFCSGA